MRLADKVAVVTGGGSGIGRASATRFAAEGAAVVVGDVRVGKAQETVDAITADGGRALAVGVDVGVPAQVEALIGTAVAEYGALDVLFNNAATIRLGDAVGLSVEDWTLVWNTNVTSVLVGVKYAVPVMAGRGGSIISTASVSGLGGERGMVAYSATKAAVVNLTRAMAIDHAAQGIRINCLCPGTTATPPMLATLSSGTETTVRAAVPLGRLAEPEELAAAALWLASDESSYVTGATLVVDGGLTAQTQFSLATLLSG